MSRLPRLELLRGYLAATSLEATSRLPRIYLSRSYFAATFLTAMSRLPRSQLPRSQPCRGYLAATSQLTARLRLRRPSDARSAERGADSSPAARASQAFERAGTASCQAPFGAIGFRLPTARLRLRRPSDARSAERGRYLCSTPSSRDGVECVLCVPRGRARAIGARAACLGAPPACVAPVMLTATRTRPPAAFVCRRLPPAQRSLAAFERGSVR